MTDHPSDGPTEVDVRERVETPTLAVRVQPAWESLDMGSVIDTAIPALGAVLEANGTPPAGPPFVRYHRFGPDGVDVEVGFPVAVRLAAMSSLTDLPAGEVGASSLPGGLVAVTVHAGPYDGLKAAYDQMHDAIHASGHDDGDAPWETYLNNPVDVARPADLRTEISWPLRS